MSLTLSFLPCASHVPCGVVASYKPVITAPFEFVFGSVGDDHNVDQAA
jgi:hypothetical protein